VVKVTPLLYFQLAQLDRIVRDPERCGFDQLKTASTSEEAETIMASVLEQHQDAVDETNELLRVQLDGRNYRAMCSGGQSEENTEANIDLAEKNATEEDEAFVEFTEGKATTRQQSCIPMVRTKRFAKHVWRPRYAIPYKWQI
jgi:hypothetical protein